MANYQQFELLKKSAVTKIAGDLSNQTQAQLDQWKQERGYDPIGNFADGATITEPQQVLFFNDTAEPNKSTYYRWDGALPKEVPTDSSPDTTGGVDAGAWVDIGQATLRGDLAAEGGASLVRGSTFTVNSIKDLADAPKNDGRQVSVSSFWPDLNLGGGLFVWDPARPKADHNGGTVIDPVRVAAWDGTQSNLAELFTVGQGAGCFIRMGVQFALWADSFGVLADGNALDHSIGTDNSAALQQLFNTCNSLNFNAVLPSGVLRCAKPLVAQNSANSKFSIVADVSGNGTGGNFARSTINFDFDVSLEDNKVAIKTFGGNLSWRGITFNHNDPGRNNGTYIFECTRYNIGAKQDLDHEFFGCQFNRAESCFKYWGRGIRLIDCGYAAIRFVLDLHWPSDYDGSLLAPEQQLTTGQRSYVIQGGRVHASSNGHIIRNLGYNRQNVNNIHISGLVVDCAMGILRGSARQSTFNLQMTQLSDIDIILTGKQGVNEGDKLEDVSFTGCLFTGMNTTDMQASWNSVITNLADSETIIKNVSFVGGAWSNQKRSLFNLGNCTVTNLLVNAISLDDILKDNDSSGNRYILTKGAPSATINSFTFTNISMSNFEWSNNPSSYFDIFNGTLDDVVVHSIQRDTNITPLLSDQYKGRVGANGTLGYVGNSSTTQSIALIEPVVGVIVAPRAGAGAGTTILCLRGQSVAGYISVTSAGTAISVEGDLNVNGQSNSVYLLR